MSEGTIEAGLAVLGARGLAGYDTSSGRYFHRVLPFDVDKVEQLQPRLKNARGLVDQVEIVSQHGPDIDAKVPGSEFVHYVRLRAPVTSAPAAGTAAIKANAAPANTSSPCE